MFTGCLPSDHGAHFQTMAYAKPMPTIAELLSAAGYYTELVTRNFVFDGTIQGVTRGFQVCTRPLAPMRGGTLTALFLALAKGRVQQHVRRTGFFHPRHSDQRTFVRTFVRSLLPADTLALAHVLQVMEDRRHADQPYFICCNLYDVHAPYAPQLDSLLRPWNSVSSAGENLTFPLYMSKLGRHAYLREGFRIPQWARRVLLERYHRAIELMDAKLATFVNAARDGGFLDDTLLIVTSDHGEAFGEHGLYLHDASVYDTHLHVPLFVIHPDLAPALIDGVVSTRDLFGVMLAASGQTTSETILDASYRRSRPVAFAEHFFYPRCANAAPQYRQNMLAAILGDEKYVVRPGNITRFDRRRDSNELSPEPVSLEQLISACGRSGLPGSGVQAAAAHVRRWHEGTAEHGRAMGRAA